MYGDLVDPGWRLEPARPVDSLERVAQRRSDLLVPGAIYERVASLIPRDRYFSPGAQLATALRFLVLVEDVLAVRALQVEVEIVRVLPREHQLQLPGTANTRIRYIARSEVSRIFFQFLPAQRRGRSLFALRLLEQRVEPELFGGLHVVVADALRLPFARVREHSPRRVRSSRLHCYVQRSVAQPVLHCWVCTVALQPIDDIRTPYPYSINLFN